jgi:TPR repeat protein
MKNDEMEKQFRAAIKLCNEKKESEAVKIFQALAEQGHAESQFQLGVFYRLGVAVEHDDAKGVEWFCKAAEQGHAEAQTSLAFCYQRGLGTAKDLAKALEWVRKAADQGDARGYTELGNFYFKGEGTRQDYAAAVEWYLKAAEQGYDGAQYSLGICYHEGHGVTQDKAKSVEWYRLAAEQGHDVAQYYLGGCYLNGDGIERDVLKAVGLFRKSAARGNRDAQDILDELKKMGIDTDSLGVNEQRKMTFNYLLTHRELPKLYFDSLKEFYETVITSPDNFERFVYFVLNRAKYFAMESPDKFGEPFPESDHLHIESVGDTAETSVIVVSIPNCKEICDCFQIAITYARDNPRYFACELSQNPTTGEGCVIVGEWIQKGEGLSHLNHGLLDIDNKESFAGRVIQITYGKMHEGKL